jgi:hypothetical protein
MPTSFQLCAVSTATGRTSREHTLIAGHFSFDQIANFAARRKVGHIQVCRDASREQAARGDSQGPTQIDHAGNGAAVKDSQSVL